MLVYFEHRAPIDQVTAGRAVFVIVYTRHLAVFVFTRVQKLNVWSRHFCRQFGQNAVRVQPPLWWALIKNVEMIVNLP